VADSATIENTFQNIDIDQIANYSNLPTLLGNGIDFVKNNGNDMNSIIPRKDEFIIIIWTTFLSGTLDITAAFINFI